MTAFLDGVTAYVTKESDDFKGYEVVVVNTNVQGYSVDRRFTEVYESEPEAQQLADALNLQLGVSRTEAEAVQTCSMFSGAVYADVLATLSR